MNKIKINGISKIKDDSNHYYKKIFHLLIKVNVIINVELTLLSNYKTISSSFFVTKSTKL